MKYLFNDPVLKHRRRELRENQTNAENAFWAHVRNRQFHGMRFLRQYSVGPYILDFYPPSQKAANFSWRMNEERVSAEAVLVMRRIAAFIANMISVGGCAAAGFAEAGALVPPTSVGGAPLPGN
jgi:hypothetical protein